MARRCWDWLIDQSVNGPEENPPLRLGGCLIGSGIILARLSRKASALRENNLLKVSFTVALRLRGLCALQRRALAAVRQACAINPTTINQGIAAYLRNPPRVLVELGNYG